MAHLPPSFFQKVHFLEAVGKAYKKKILETINSINEQLVSMA